MKKLTQVVLMLLFVSAASSAFAADTKVNGRLYADWNMDMTDGAESANSFNIERAYVTVKSKLSDYTSVRITTDINTKGGFNGYDIILKYGYIDWKPKFGQDKFKVRFGLQPTLYIDHLNGIWGRRYLAKTASDSYKFLTSSDLGASFMIDLGEKGKTGYVAMQLLNGTSYSNTEELNKNKDFGFFALLNPFTNNENLKNSQFAAQFYNGTQNVSLMPGVDTTVTGADQEASQYKNQIVSLGGVFAYNSTVDFGFDANFKTTGMGYDNGTGAEIDDLKSSALSFFGTLYLSALTESSSSLNTLNLFGRVDKVDPNTDVDDDGMTLLIVGVECAPTKGFKASVNLRNTSYESSGVDSEKHIFLNTLFKF